MNNAYFFRSYFFFILFFYWRSIPLTIRFGFLTFTCVLHRFYLNLERSSFVYFVCNISKNDTKHLGVSFYSNSKVFSFFFRSFCSIVHLKFQPHLFFCFEWDKATKVWKITNENFDAKKCNLFIDLRKISFELFSNFSCMWFQFSLLYSDLVHLIFLLLVLVSCLFPEISFLQTW